MVKAGRSNVKGQEHLDSKKWTAFSDWDQVFEPGISECRISSLSPSSCTHDFKWCLQRLGWDRSISEELRYSDIAKQAGQEEGYMAGIELTHTNKIVDHCMGPNIWYQSLSTRTWTLGTSQNISASETGRIGRVWKIRSKNEKGRRWGEEREGRWNGQDKEDLTSDIWFAYSPGK